MYETMLRCVSLSESFSGYEENSSYSTSEAERKSIVARGIGVGVEVKLPQRGAKMRPRARGADDITVMEGQVF